MIVVVESGTRIFSIRNLAARIAQVSLSDETDVIMGSEKSEGYARASLPSNRWELFWDIFKGRFWKLVIINLLTLVFFIPLFVLFFLRSSLIAGYGAACPFSQCFGVGYQALPSLVGFPEQIVVNVNIMIYLFLPIALLIAAVGLSGAAYVIRNMVWTDIRSRIALAT